MLEVIHASCLDFKPEEFVDIAPNMSQITDPPYSPHVHAKATSCGTGKGSKIRDKRGRVGASHRDLGFDPLSEELRGWIASLAGFCTWTVLFSDIEGSGVWRVLLPRYIRTIPWIRWSMPQLSGDRPPQASEYTLVAGQIDATLWNAPTHEIVLGYRAGGRLFFNGPGNVTHFDEKCLRGADKHKCEKPLDLCLRLVEYFSHEGDLVIDPCAGAGTIGVACRELGRHYLGFEIDAHWAAHSNNRLKAKLSKRDLERVERWQTRRTLKR